MGAFYELKDRFFYRALIAELFATAFFIFNVTLVLIESKNFGSAPIIVISFAIGMSVAVIAQTFGPICGAHLNPAVTVGLLVKGDISVLRAAIYVIVQLVGGILGSAVTYALVPASRRGELGALTPNTEIDEVQGFFIEMILTIFLVMTVFSSTSNDHGRKDYGFVNAFAIGMSITVAHLVGIPLTGAGINPARAFGPAVVTGTFKESHWIYWAGPIIGAIVAGISYRLVLSVEPKVERDAAEANNKATLEFNVITTK